MLNTRLILRLALISSALLISACGSDSDSNSGAGAGTEANTCSFTIEGNRVTAQVGSGSQGFVEQECKDGAVRATKALNGVCRNQLKDADLPVVFWTGSEYETLWQDAIQVSPKGELARTIGDLVTLSCFIA